MTFFSVKDQYEHGYRLQQFSTAQDMRVDGTGRNKRVRVQTLYRVVIITASAPPLAHGANMTDEAREGRNYCRTVRHS